MRIAPAALAFLTALSACGKEEIDRYAALKASPRGDLSVDGELERAQAKAVERATKIVYVNNPWYRPDLPMDHDETVQDPTRLAHACVPTPTNTEGELDEATRAKIQAEDATAQAAGAYKKDKFEKAIAAAKAALTEGTVATIYEEKRGQDSTLKAVNLETFDTALAAIDTKDLLCPTGTFYVPYEGKEVPVAAFAVLSSAGEEGGSATMQPVLTEAFWSAERSACQRAGILVQFIACQQSGVCEYTTVTPIGGPNGAARNAPNTMQELVTQVCENPEAALRANATSLQECSE